MKEKQIDAITDLLTDDVITDLLTDFDEMGFVPTTTVPDPDAYATEWRNKLTDALQGYRKQSEGEWVDNYNGTFTCTVCGARASKMNYCGRCGAKMRKHEEVKDYPPYLDRPKMKGGAE